MLATALFAKIASAGLVAKAASVAGVAVVGLTTAGFTGNLGPAQHSFATLVDHATPFTAPDTTPAPADVGVPPADDEIGSTPPVTSPTPSDTADPSTAETGTAQQGSDESGEESAQVTPPAHPSNHGGQVSDWAHQKNEDRKSGASTVPAKPSKSSSGRISGEHSEHGSSHGSDD
jgi:hypothetical protein